MQSIFLIASDLQIYSAPDHFGMKLRNNLSFALTFVRRDGTVQKGAGGLKLFISEESIFRILYSNSATGGNFMVSK